MPHVPDRHTDHDVELVAASISDGLTAAEHATVTDLLAACSACRELAADLRALAAATVALPVPPRRRDYRITAEQAARLRPVGVRGILVALGSRRFSFVAPLGTALATLGIVGLLVAAIPGPLAGGAALRTTEGSGNGEMQLQAAPAGSDTQAAPGSEAAVPDAEPGPGGAPENDEGIAPSLSTLAAELGQARGGDAVLVIGSGAAFLVGVALLALRRTGRRVA